MSYVSPPETGAEVWRRWFALLPRYLLKVSGQHGDGKLLSPGSVSTIERRYGKPGPHTVPQSDTYRVGKVVLRR